MSCTEPFFMILVPFESPFSQLSNGAKIIKNGSVQLKIRPILVYIISFLLNTIIIFCGATCTFR